MSIGEVLVTLKTEFPDITISKIRFLEGEGLINPERTPSGYRKFRDEELQRLRAILRMQRDEYLPLKVIRERLEHGEDGAAETTAAPPGPAAGVRGPGPDGGPVEEAEAGPAAGQPQAVPAERLTRIMRRRLPPAAFLAILAVLAAVWLPAMTGLARPSVPPPTPVGPSA